MLVLHAAPAQWEKDIRAFEATDRTNPPPKGAIVFVGSSSIRMWHTLAQDFPEFTVINRGFGGSELADSVAFADRIILPCRPRQVVVYAGDNDIAAGKSPARVLADFQAFEHKIHTALPKCRVTFIAIKPCPSRWQFVKQIREANDLVKAAAQQARETEFVDVFTPMLGVDGRPRGEWFANDLLHLNRRGYALWVRLLRPHLVR
jgi:lysophospholipase L1-like esterase